MNPILTFFIGGGLGFVIGTIAGIAVMALARASKDDEHDDRIDAEQVINEMESGGSHE